jgi:hypothetical protein
MPMSHTIQAPTAAASHLASVSVCAKPAHGVPWPADLLGRFRPRQVSVSVLWGALLLVCGLSPGLFDCLYPRSDLLEQGRPAPAALFQDLLLKKTLVASLVVNVGLAGVFLCWRRRLPLALLALVPLHLLMLSSARSFEISYQFHVERSSRMEVERQCEHLRRLDIVEPFSPSLYLFNAREIPVDSIKSFPDLHAWVAGAYRLRREQMMVELKEDDENRLKTIFFMHFVADLWAFGNQRATDKPGGVLFNEANHWVSPAKVTAQTYLRSRIGCCADIAYLLKYLLDAEGIRNRLTEIPGHVFNEVKLEGKWWIADGTTNILVEGSWDELVQGATGPAPSRIRAHLFPDPRVGHHDGAEYRPVTAQARIQMLMRMAAGPPRYHSVCHPPLPAVFK